MIVHILKDGHSVQAYGGIIGAPTKHGHRDGHNVQANDGVAVG